MNNPELSFTPLSEIADFTNGYGFGPADWGNSGLPIIRIQQLLNTDALADRFAGSLDAKYRIDTGDLIMSWSGTLAVVRWDRGPAWLNQHLFRVDPKAGVDGAFLRHLLTSRLGHLEAASHGTTMRHIKRGDLLRHVVQLPPLRMQRRIAEVLDTLDETLQAIERVIAKRRSLRAGLSADLLKPPCGAPPSEALNPRETMPPFAARSTSGNLVATDFFVEEMAAQRKGAIKIGPFGSALPRSAMVDDGVKVYGQENLIAKDWNAGSRRVRPETFDFLRTCELHPGDVVIGMMGSLGYCEVFPLGAEPGLMDSHLLRIQVNPGLVSPEYLRLLLLSDETARQVNQLSHGSIMAGLSSAVVRRIRLRIPPLEEQRRITKILSAVDRSIHRQEAELAKLRALRAGLAADLLSGRVRTVAA